MAASDFPLQGAPFGGTRRLYNIVPVQLRTNFVKHDFDARQLQLQPGDHVVVESSKGPVIARVTGHVTRKVLPVDTVQRVLRRANDNDVRQADRNEELEREAYRFCIERIRGRKLPMKLVRAQFMHDGSKIVFYFSADGRIDFRDLVKDLAHRYRTRIEMHQIGVRDGARMIGGIGPCGRELCCSTFLENFAPVSIRMAKDQGLTLNPRKVSGMCGRLMCCLVYEQQLYRRMKKRLPRAGKAVQTPKGAGTIADVDVINMRVQVRLDEGGSELFDLDDVILSDGAAASHKVDAQVPEPAEPEYLWDDLEPATAADGGRGSGARSRGGSKSRRRRRGRRRSGSKSKGKKKDD